jgi:hypothetical protein
MTNPRKLRAQFGAELTNPAMTPLHPGWDIDRRRHPVHGGRRRYHRILRRRARQEHHAAAPRAFYQFAQAMGGAERGMARLGDIFRAMREGISYTLVDPKQGDKSTMARQLAMLSGPLPHRHHLPYPHRPSDHNPPPQEYRP